MLYSGSAKPLYEQLKEIIKEKIRIGEYSTGDALPSERILMELYGVSRITVRQAVGDLVKEGILYRQHGKGTFIANQRIRRPLAKLFGVVEELELIGLELDIELINIKEETPKSEVKRELQLIGREKVVTVCRLISVTQKPILLIYNYFPQRILKEIKGIDFSKDIFYRYLENLGYKIAYGEQRILASAADNKIAKLLKCKVNRPILINKRTSYLENKTPIGHSVNIYHSDRYEYEVDLKRYTK